MAKPHCLEFYCFERKNKSVIYRQRQSGSEETVPLLLKARAQFLPVRTSYPVNNIYFLLGRLDKQRVAKIDFEEIFC